MNLDLTPLAINTLLVMIVYIFFGFAYLTWSWLSSQGVNIEGVQVRAGKVSRIIWTFVGWWPVLSLFLILFAARYSWNLAFPLLLIFTGMLYYCAGFWLISELMKIENKKIFRDLTLTISGSQYVGGMCVAAGFLVALSVLRMPFVINESQYYITLIAAAVCVRVLMMLVYRKMGFYKKRKKFMNNAESIVRDK